MNTYEQIKIKKELEISILNEIFKKLIQNDISMIPSAQMSPQIWVAKWINDDQIEGYKKGDAVWINCEDAQDFINKNKAEIISYIEYNKDYQYKYNIVKNNPPELNRFLLEIINSGELYYLGNIMDKVQIRICKEDTKISPKSDKYWKDFWIDNNNDTNKEFILKTCREICEKKFNEHVQEYHLSGFSKINFKDYLLQDMSNIPFESHYHYYSHKNKVYADGFDFVKKEYHLKYSDVYTKWFRLWNSGYLEHGGTIDLNQIPENSGDKINKDIVNVNLSWKYENLVSPSYDYIFGGLDKFYIIDQIFNFYSEDVKFEDNSKLLYGTNTYNIQISPLFCQNPYSNYNENHCFYELNEVNNICNDQFSFVRNNDCTKYSYYTSGFTIAS